MTCFYHQERNSVNCANCGGQGHIYKTCNHPITSYGVICYKLCYNPEDNTIYPKYLFVQRRDSLSFIEFMRGKYDVNNIKYILKLFSFMTEEERHKIHSMTYDELLKDMWKKSGSINRDYNDAKVKYGILKNGVYIKNQKNDIIFFNMEYILSHSKSEYNETEWGFPKGRRNINEDDINCALREFKEETGINLKHVRISHTVKPFEEVFLGTNKVRYKHVYYVGKYQSSLFDNDKVYQDEPIVTSSNCMEIRDIKWLTYNEAQSKIRDINIERKELFKRLNHIVLKTIHNL